MIVVVDASAVAAICFGEPDGPAMAERFTAAELWSTPLLDFELANVAWKKLGRAPTTRDLVMRGLESRSRIPIAVLR